MTPSPPRAEARSKITAGTYELINAVKLRSGVHLKGEDGAVLRKTPSVQSLLAEFVGYGLYEFSVADPHLFEIGMGVHIADDNSGGFYTTVATITRREGDAFFIDRPLKHDYLPNANARVASLYSIIDATSVSDASIENLVLDGSYPQESEVLTGCRGAGIFMLGCHRVRIKDVEVRYYHGDGISFQQCTDIAVLRCHVHHNTGGGLHPGSGTVRYLMEDNHIHDNGRDGIFYCLRTMYSNCSNNVIERNGETGISVGERDTHHRISGNTIRDNGRQGIDFRQYQAFGSDDAIVEANRIGLNNRAASGENLAEITIYPGINRIHLEGNEIEAGPHAALHVSPGCGEVSFAGNTVSGRPQHLGDVTGDCANVELTVPPVLPRVGPEAVPASAAWHLNIDELQSWSESDRVLRAIA